MLSKLFGSRKAAEREVTRRLYDAVVTAARSPDLYEHLEIPDTPLGRFEMIAAHMVLLLRRLRGEELDAIGQRLTDDFFLDVDHSLRELGIGDMGVPKRMKKLARMFYGRAKSYTEALDGDNLDALAQALRRNVRPDLADWPQSDVLATYMMQSAHRLDGQPAADIGAGLVRLDQFRMGSENG